MLRRYPNRKRVRMNSDLDHAPATGGGVPLPVLRKFLDDLRRRVRAHPDDQRLVWRLAETARAAGELELSARAYRLCLRLDPGHQPARQRLNILDGRADVADQGPGDDRIAPFLWVRDLLPPGDMAELWRIIESRLPDLRPSRIVRDGELNVLAPEYRDSLRMDARKDAGRLIVPLVREIIRANDLVRRFGVRSLADDEPEVEIANHGDGQFFRIHRDSGRQLAHRAMTFVYYFFRRPRRFDGGDLLLHDAATVTDAPLVQRFTRLIPESNGLVIFPSDSWHQVLPVRSDSGDPLDGRWTVHGWFRADGVSFPTQTADM